VVLGDRGAVAALLLCSEVSDARTLPGLVESRARRPSTAGSHGHHGHGQL